MAITVLSDFEENALLDYIFSVNTYWGLSTSTPNEDGTGVTEPSGGAYARVTVAPAVMGDAAAGSISNVSAVTWPQATASWGTVTYVVIYDAASGGNLRLALALTASKAISNGETPKFMIGAFNLSAN
jgi:hypothetical protein